MYWRQQVGRANYDSILTKLIDKQVVFEIKNERHLKGRDKEIIYELKYNKEMLLNIANITFLNNKVIKPFSRQEMVKIAQLDPNIFAVLGAYPKVHAARIYVNEDIFVYISDNSKGEISINSKLNIISVKQDNYKFKTPEEKLDYSNFQVLSNCTDASQILKLLGEPYGIHTSKLSTQLDYISISKLNDTSKASFLLDSSVDMRVKTFKYTLNKSQNVFNYYHRDTIGLVRKKTTKEEVKAKYGLPTQIKSFEIESWMYKSPKGILEIYFMNDIVAAYQWFAR